MKTVLVDTNVVLSALMFPASTPARAVAIALTEHRLRLSRWILDELSRVARRKFPGLLTALGEFLADLDYELAEPMPQDVRAADPAGQPILDAAVAARVDILVTGDKRLLEARLETTKVVTPAEFVARFG